MRSETYKTLITGQKLSTTFLLFLLLITIHLEKIACGVGASLLECNGTTSIGECVADHGDEYLMESEMSTMILAGNAKTTISYRSLQKPKICDTTEYSSCIGAQKNVAQRICDEFNRCKHNPRKK
ncbi:hypothetical protein P3S68_018560 [Capsicum galapagoense]